MLSAAKRRAWASSCFDAAAGLVSTGSWYRRERDAIERVVILARVEHRPCCDLPRYDAPVLRPVAVLVIAGDLRQGSGEVRVEVGLLGGEQRKEHVVSRLGGGRLAR